MLRGSLGLAAAGAALARPNTVNAAATTVETWWKEGFFPEKNVAFRELVADYERASANKIDYNLVPNSSTRLNGKRDRQGELKTRLRCYASLPLAIRPA
jgi:ABC-type glycerol-3-phosphate transport system substrate-binding protein